MRSPPAGVANARQVAIKQLILQRFGTGRDDDLAPESSAGTR
jgi:hypothetical protein